MPDNDPNVLQHVAFLGNKKNRFYNKNSWVNCIILWNVTTKTQWNALCHNNIPVTKLTERTQFSILSMYTNTFEGKFTGCGRKKSPIWEANKFKTKEDTANVFFYFWKVHRMPFYINVF